MTEVGFISYRWYDT